MYQSQIDYIYNIVQKLKNSNKNKKSGQLILTRFIYVIL